MIITIDLFGILRETGSSKEAAKVILNIIKGNPTASFDVKVHNVDFDEDIIKVLAWISFHCGEQGSQVVMEGISEEETSRIIEEKRKLLNDIKTEGRVIDPGQVIDAVY